MQQQLDRIMAEFSTTCTEYLSKYNTHFRPSVLPLTESTKCSCHYRASRNLNTCIKIAIRQLSDQVGDEDLTRDIT